TKEHTENFRYYISSLDTDAQRFLDISRAHWKIEAMHWTLDVCFNEDALSTDYLENILQLNI
ncbi:MAG: ISAs1 family transposase, partial [bacterium]